MLSMDILSPPRSYASSKKMTTTMDAIPSTDSCRILISATTVIGDTTKTTSIITCAMADGVVHANVKIVLTSSQPNPNKPAVLETIPCPMSPTTSVIDSSTAPIATTIISNEETITKHDPSVK